MGNSNGCEKTVFIHMTDRYEGIQTTKTKRTNKKLKYKVSKTLDRLGFEIARYAVRDWDSRDVYVYSRKKSRKNGDVGKNCWNWRDKLKRERKFHE